MSEERVVGVQLAIPGIGEDVVVAVKKRAPRISKPKKPKAVNERQLTLDFPCP